LNGGAILNLTKNTLLILILLPILFFISLYGWRIDFFRISDSRGNIIFSSPAALGHKFITRYIHSVELTPVEDEYYIVGGRLWSWEERVRSSKAGLPFQGAKNGRFIMTKDWLIYQGGRLSWQTYYYRIGNEYHGLNQTMFEPYEIYDAYKVLPDRKLLIEVYRKPYMYESMQALESTSDTP